MNLTVCEAKESRFSLIKRCLHEPLLHFLIAGFALFVLYGGLHPSTLDQDPQRINITLKWFSESRFPGWRDGSDLHRSNSCRA